MFRYLHFAAPLGGAVIFAAACANPEIDAARTLQIEGRDMTAEAAREYRRLAIFEDAVMWDRASAIVFSEKALAAVDGRLDLGAPDPGRVAPEERARINAAHRLLAAMLAQGAGTLAPRAVGQAAARLDCWREQAAEGDQPLHIGFCRDGFAAHAGEAARVLKAAGRDTGMSPGLRVFRVGFALGSTEPLPGAARTVAAAARYANTDPALRILLGGHADRAGGAAHNRRLSETRAGRVAELLQAAGVRSNRIRVVGFGETYPRIATPDGHRNAENRRVEIVVGRAAHL